MWQQRSRERRKVIFLDHRLHAAPPPWSSSLRNMTKRHCGIPVHFSFISGAHKSPLAVVSCDQAHVEISGIKIREFDTPD
jgi:hypothetical protein